MLRQITWGFVVGFVTVGALHGCGAPQLIECRLSAVRALPEDPGQLTPYDTLDLIQRLKACRVQPDGGP